MGSAKNKLTKKDAKALKRIVELYRTLQPAERMWVISRLKADLHREFRK